MNIKLSLLLCIIFGAYSGYAQQKDSVRGEKGPTENPFDLSGESSRGFYGPDDRRDVTDAFGYEDFVRATAVMVPLNKIGDGYMDCPSLREWLSDGDPSMQFADNVNFLDQPACGNCTGFLIAPDILVTAGHCVEKMADCENYAWVFDFTKELLHLDFADYVELDNDNVFGCDDILTTELVSGGGDWAVIRFNRKSDRKPYRFRISNKIADNEDVFMIGSPSGLPLKLADNAWVGYNGNTNYFEANLDAFGGNSGGPVFDAAGWIEGILVRGERDFVYDQDCDCIKVSVLEEDAWDQEHVQRITELPYEILLEALYDNIEYAIREQDMDRLKSYMAYTGLIDHSYTVDRGRFENIALQENNMEALMLIIENSESDFSGEEGSGGLIFYAVEKGNTELLEFLLKNGQNPNQTNEAGETAIFHAIENEQLDALRVLLKRGANVNARDNSNETAMFKAVREDNIDAAYYLLSADIDLSASNSYGWTARKLAKKWKRKAFKKLLKRAEKGKYIALPSL